MVTKHLQTTDVTVPLSVEQMCTFSCLQAVFFKKLDWAFHADAKNSIENIVNNIITMYGVRWVQDIMGRSLHELYKHLITMLYT